MQSSETAEKNLKLLWIRHVEFGQDAIRPITVIAGIPFYRSTGINSGAKNTWFPFSGMNHGKEKDYGIGWLIKPWENEQNLSKYFPRILVDHLFHQLIEESLPNSSFARMLPRFGNFEAMCISMIIGGGFWLSIDGRKIENFISSNFKQEIELLKISHFNELKKLSYLSVDPDETSIMVSEINEEKAGKTNDWLKTQGSKSYIGENNQPKIDFSYNTIFTSVLASLNLFINETTQALRTQAASHFFSNMYTAMATFFKDAEKKIDKHLSSIKTKKSEPAIDENHNSYAQYNTETSHRHQFFGEKEHRTNSTKKISMFETMELYLKYKSEPGYLLAKAIHLNDLDKIKSLLTQYPVSKFQHTENPHGSFYPPLHIACEEGKLDIVSLLVSHGFEVNLPAGNHGMRTPLSIAAENNHDSVVEFLLQHNADTNIRDNFERKPLDWKKSF